MKSKVAVLKTSPETVLDDYSKLMRLANYDAFLAKDKQTYLKINLSWREWFPAASTEPWQLEGVIKTLIEDGYESPAIVESHAMGINARAAEAYNGLTTAAGRRGVDFIRFDGEPVAWVPFSPKTSLLALDRQLGEGALKVPEIFLGNNVIHLTTLKTHAMARVAGAAMSAFDALLDEQSWSTNHIDEILVDVLAIQKEACGGVFTVADGTLCGDGPGPRMLTVYEKGYILAGADQVAIDAVAAYMMGFDPLEIGYLRMAQDRGLGCADIDKIEVAGEDVSNINFRFTGGKKQKVPRTGLYLEYFWYPFKGWRQVGRIAEGGWGQLFQKYLPQGAELERQGKGKGPLLAVFAAAALLGMSATRRVVRMARRGA